MLFILSGEGPSDIGSMVVGANGAMEFDAGPLALIIDKISEDKLGYSPLEYSAFSAISRPHLCELAKKVGTIPKFLAPGAKRAKGHIGSYRQAFALAREAQRLAVEEGVEVVAVMFRDSDGTQSDSVRRWDELVEAITSAFVASKFTRGVAMVAKPKQEAWFLCAAKNEPYQHCIGLEDESGNDNSPAALKGRLEEAMGCPGTKQALLDFVERGDFDFRRMDMPSFSRFVSSLGDALT